MFAFIEKGIPIFLINIIFETIMFVFEFKINLQNHMIKYYMRGENNYINKLSNSSRSYTNVPFRALVFFNKKYIDLYIG